jgi:hypothetical protein
MDWATVLVASVPAGITGAVAYYGARLQLGGELQKADRTAAAQGRTERKAAYHDLLNHLDALKAVLGANREMDEDDFAEWADGFHRRANAIRLYGDKEVLVNVIRLLDVLDVIMALIPDEDDYPPGEQPSFAQSLAAETPWRERWFSIYREMTTAMRADVAPDVGAYPTLDDVHIAEAEAGHFGPPDQPDPSGRP